MADLPKVSPDTLELMSAVALARLNLEGAAEELLKGRTPVRSKAVVDAALAWAEAARATRLSVKKDNPRMDR